MGFPRRLRTGYTAFQVLEICAHFGGLQAARTEMMGLFVYDLGPIDEEKVKGEIRDTIRDTIRIRGRHEYPW